MIKDLSFLHILTAVLVIELIMLFMFKFTNRTSVVINNWYNNLGWTSVILDVLSILIGFYIALFIYDYLLRENYINEKNEFVKFLMIVICVQIIHDISFYLFVIKPTTLGKNKVIDEFKDYAKYYRGQAIVADTMIYLFTTSILYYAIKTYSDKTNVFISLVCLYLIGYLLHQKSRYK